MKVTDEGAGEETLPPVRRPTGYFNPAFDQQFELVTPENLWDALAEGR